MGMEDGSQYFGGGGSSGGGGDIGADMGDFNIGMGGGGDSFIIDYSQQTQDGAPIDWGFDTTSWPTLGDASGGAGGDFNYGYGAGESPPIDPVADSFIGFDPNQGFFDMGGGYVYDAGSGQVLDTGLYQGPIDQSFGQGSGNLFDSYLDYYLQLGYDPLDAAQLAADQAAEGSIITETRERGLLPDLPEGPYFPLPYVVDPYTYTPPYTPTFPEGPVPLPPIVNPIIPLVTQPPPRIPMPPQNPYGAVPMAPGLPPPCPGGQYHPFPIGHPEQNKCVPFPPPQVSTRPGPVPGASAGGGSRGGSSGGSQQQQPCPTGYTRDPITRQCKPQAQAQAQQCPTGYWMNPATRRCEPIPKCTSPGTVFDARSGQCVPYRQALNPLPGSEGPGTPPVEAPEEVQGALGDLLGLPWWVWLAAGGLLLLSRDDDGKKTTVTYRRR